MHQEASWGLAADLWFLGMWFDLLTFAVPMNVGSLEGTRVLALRSNGYSSLRGVTYGIALRLSQLVWSAIGMALYGWLVRHGARPVSVQAPSPNDASSRTLGAPSADVSPSAEP